MKHPRISRITHVTRVGLFLGSLVILLVSQGAWRPVRATSTTLVPVNASWRYLDNGSNAGTAGARRCSTTATGRQDRRNSDTVTVTKPRS